MRKIKHLTLSTVKEDKGGNYETVLVAACEDGTIWQYKSGNGDWFPLPPIPEDTTK